MKNKITFPLSDDVVIYNHPFFDGISDLELENVEVMTDHISQADSIEISVWDILQCFIIFCFFLVFPFMGFSQSPYYTVQPYTVMDPLLSPDPSSSISWRNTWVNSKLMYSMTGDEFLRDNILFTGRILYVPSFGDNWACPIVSTISNNVNDLFSADSGFNMGVYPWYEVSSNDRRTWIIHGGFGYKMIPATDNVESVTQARVLTGAEVLMYFDNLQQPASLSITPTLWWNITKLNYIGVEATGILPIGSRLGIMGEYYNPFNGQDGFRLGVIVNDK